MATAHWRTGFTVADLSAKQDAGWSFYQLIRVLLPPTEEHLSQQLSDTHLLELLNQHFHFKGAHQDDFPAGEIRAISNKQYKHGKRYEIASIGNHLCGHNGPLSDGLSDMLIEDLRENEGAMAAFLDIFNHRLQSLRYVFRSQSDNNLTSCAVQHSDFGRLALALTGNIHEEHQRLYQQEPSTYVGMAGTLSNQRMSLPVIERLFESVLAVPLKSIQYLLGRWLNVAKEDHIRLGHANHSLGNEATLGSRVWDQQAAIGVCLGPLSNSQLRRLLPSGEDYLNLFSVLQWITDCRCDCKVTLFSHSTTDQSIQLSQQNKTTSQLTMLSSIGKSTTPTSVSYMVDLVNTQAGNQ